MYHVHYYKIDDSQSFFFSDAVEKANQFNKWRQRATIWPTPENQFLGAITKVNIALQ
jgi:hypothetical protein